MKSHAKRVVCWYSFINHFVGIMNNIHKLEDAFCMDSIYKTRFKQCFLLACYCNKPYRGFVRNDDAKRQPLSSCIILYNGRMCRHQWRKARPPVYMYESYCTTIWWRIENILYEIIIAAEQKYNTKSVCMSKWNRIDFIREI